METVQLGDVVRVVKRAVEPVAGETYRQAGVRLWGAGAYERESIDGGDTSYKHFYQVREGDLIVNKIWARNGSVAVVPVELDGCFVSSEFPTFEANPARVSSDWLGWIAKSSLLWDQFDEKSHGTSGKNRIQPKKVLTAQIPLPSLSEQAQRAGDAQKLTATAEKTLERIDAQIADLDALRRRVLDDAVRGRLTERDPDNEPAATLLARIAEEKQRRYEAGEIRKPKTLPPVGEDERSFDVPEGWAWTRVGSAVLDMQTGPFGSALGKADYIANATPVINPTNIIDGAVIGDYRKTISSETLDRLDSYTVSQGDIVVARRGEMGRCAVVSANEDGWLCGTGSFFLKLLDGMSPEYMALFIRSPDTRAALEGDAVGSTMTNLNQRIFRSLPLPLPPAGEQRRIVERVDALLALCARLAERLAAARADAERLTQTVLADALAA